MQRQPTETCPGWKGWEEQQGLLTPECKVLPDTSPRINEQTLVTGALAGEALWTLSKRVEVTALSIFANAFLRSLELLKRMRSGCCLVRSQEERAGAGASLGKRQKPLRHCTCVQVDGH